MREFETFSLGEILRENKVCKIKTFLNSYIVDRTGDRFSSTSSCDMTPTRLTAFHIATPPTKYCRTVLSRCVKIEKKKCCSRKDSFQSSTQIIRKVCNSSNFIVSTLEHFQLWNSNDRHYCTFHVENKSFSKTKLRLMYSFYWCDVATLC